MRTFRVVRRSISWFLPCVLTTASLCSAAVGQSKQPILRLGESDFRLTTSGSTERTFRFSPDGKILAGASRDEVKLWSFPDGKLLHDLSGAIQTDCLGFAAEGKELRALYPRQMELYRFDVESGRRIGRTKLATVPEVQTATYRGISEDGKWLTSRDEHGHVVVWDTATGEKKFDQEMRSGANNWAISNSGVLTVLTMAAIERYDLNSGKQLGSRRIHDEFGVIAMTPQGTTVAGYSPKDKSIIFFDTTNDKYIGAKIPLSDEYKGGMPEAAISADGRRFVFWINRDKWLWTRQIAIYDVESGKLVSAFDPPGVYFLGDPVISPDGRYMFPSGDRCVFTPIDTATGKLVHDIPDHILNIEKLAFTPDGCTLLVGSRDKRLAWSIETGKAGTTFEKWFHTSHVAPVSNDLALVSGIKGGGVRLQNIETGAIEREFDTGHDTYFADIQLAVDRKSFVGMQSLQGGPIRRWSVAEGKVIAERQLPVAGGERAYDASKMIRGVALGGTRVIRLQQTGKASKRADGSIEPARGELVLEDWASKIVTNRLPVPTIGGFAFGENGDGTTLAAIVRDDQNPRPYGEKWGSTHVLVWDVATGWERLRIDREMHSLFGAFAMVAISHDSRLVATVSERSRVEIWNGFNGYHLDGFDTASVVSAIAFSPDGAMLATGHGDGSVYLWDVRPLWDQALPRWPMNRNYTKRYWNDLAADGQKLAQAWQTLLANPEPAIEMLRTNLKRVMSEKGVVGALEGVVVPAAGDGQVMMDGSTPVQPIVRALQQAIEKTTAEETRKQYQQLLDAAARPMSPEMRRPILAILLAEQLNTPASRELLEEVAAGPAGAFETQVAKSALVRIDSRDAEPAAMLRK